MKPVDVRFYPKLYYLPASPWRFPDACEILPDKIIRTYRDIYMLSLEGLFEESWFHH